MAAVVAQEVVTDVVGGPVKREVGAEILDVRPMDTAEEAEENQRHQRDPHEENHRDDHSRPTTAQKRWIVIPVQTMMQAGRPTRCRSQRAQHCDIVSLSPPPRPRRTW